MAVATGGLVLLGLAVAGANGSSTSSEVWALTAVVGSVAVLLGACAVAPGYVSILQPLASLFRGASRLAARSLARQRTRTGAVVSAVCATSALAIAASALVLSADAKSRDQQPSIRADEIHLMPRALSDDGPVPEQTPPAQVPEEVISGLRAVVPASQVHRIAAARAPGSTPDAAWFVEQLVPDGPLQDSESMPTLATGRVLDIVAIADESLLQFYDLPGRARDALDRDGIVAVTPGSVGGTARIAPILRRGRPSDSRDAPQLANVPPVIVDVVPDADLSLGSIPPVLVTPERARTMGLAPAASIAVIRATAPLTEGQRTAAQEVMEGYADAVLDGPLTTVTVSMNMLYSNHIPTRMLEVLLAAAAFLLSLFVVVVSLGLAAAETRDERDILVVIGAPPSTMRRASGRRALLLTFLGAVLAVPVGLLPVSVFTTVSEIGMPLVFPWRMMLLLLVAVPVVSAAITTFFSGIALRLRPVRVSTMVFD